MILRTKLRILNMAHSLRVLDLFWQFSEREYFGWFGAEYKQSISVIQVK
jgi:hypothetical protein